MHMSMLSLCVYYDLYVKDIKRGIDKCQRQIERERKI